MLIFWGFQMNYKEIPNDILFESFVYITQFCVDEMKGKSEIIHNTLKQILKDINQEFAKRNEADYFLETKFSKRLKIGTIGNKRDCLEYVSKKLNIDCLRILLNNVID